MHTSAPHSKDPPATRALFSEHRGRNLSTSCRMGSSRRKVIWVLCSLLLLLEASSARNIWKRALHARLAERSHVSAWMGRLGGDGPSPDTVRSVSAPPNAGRASVFLCLRVSKSGSGQMELTSSKTPCLEAKKQKERQKCVQGACDVLLPAEYTFSWHAAPGSKDLRLSAVSEPKFYTMYLCIHAIIYSFSKRLL